jgi:hypothetical protein
MPGISACHPYYCAANNAAGSALDPVMQHSTLSHFALSETPKIASFFYTATKSDGTEQGNSTCQSDRYSNQYALSLAKLGPKRLVIASQDLNLAASRSAEPKFARPAAALLRMCRPVKTTLFRLAGALVTLPAPYRTEDCRDQLLSAHHSRI